MSLDIEVRSPAGETVGTVTLDDGWFGIEPNVAVLHQVVTAQLAAARSGTQSTKTRAEVSGGGKKPFKQKGTGRARQGSERAPHFSGGGVALGPKPRSYRQRTPRKMINLALRSALSDRCSEGRVAIVDNWAWSEPSTKAARAALDVLGLEGKVLVVLTREDQGAYKSFRNLPSIQVMLSSELNAYDVLCNDWIVFTSATVPGVGGSTEALVTLTRRLNEAADAVPADAVPADAVPADAVPADAVPADAVPADAVPADAVPADAVPADAVPADAVPADAVPADAVPADAVPADAVLTEAEPTEAEPADVAEVEAAPIDAAPVEAEAAVDVEPTVSPEPAPESEEDDQ
jgi:large subunit ribosomal protein L4